MKKIIILSLIFSLGAFFRFSNPNWDSNQHLHPDERFLTMVTGGISWPNNLFQYFNTDTSPINPHNKDFPFYVYGTLPVILVKIFSELVGMVDYDQVVIVGRIVSASVDFGSLVLLYLSVLHFTKSFRAGISTALFYATAVLPIQLSHYYATDTFMVFFLVLSFYFLTLHDFYKKPIITSGVGVALGLAISSKVTAVFFLPVVAAWFILAYVRHPTWKKLILHAGIFSISLFAATCIGQPYLFANPQKLNFRPNPKVLSNWHELASYSQPDFFYPPSTMWVHAPKILFPLENLSLWGLGIISFSIAIFSLVYYLISIKKYPHLALLSLWIIGWFVYLGLQFSMPLRYFYPLIPFVAVISGVFLSRWKLSAFVIPLLFVWPVFFITIYFRPHSRVAASQWIYDHLPSGSVISCDYWDDCLPLSVADHSPSEYSIEELHLYDEDTPEKQLQLTNQLARIDYIILSSNRLYGSIMTAPEHWPQTTQFYKSLFDGSLGFRKIAEFTSRPNIPFPGVHLCLTPPFISYGKVAVPAQQCPLSGISLVDDYADETFTVYDHPKVIIFQKVISASTP